MSDHIKNLVGVSDFDFHIVNTLTQWKRKLHQNLALKVQNQKSCDFHQFFY